MNERFVRSYTTQDTL